MTELVDVDAPNGLLGEGPAFLGWGRAPRESRSMRTAFSPKNWSSTLFGCVMCGCVLCKGVRRMKLCKCEGAGEVRI